MDRSSVHSSAELPGKRFFRVGRSVRSLRDSLLAFALSDVTEPEGSSASNELTLLVGVIVFHGWLG